MIETPQQLLRRMRVKAGLTQAALAKRVGYTQQQVAKLEDEKYNTTLRSLVKAFDALGLQLCIDVKPRRGHR